MSKTEQEVRYAEVCERLALALQRNNWLHNQLFRVKQELARTEELLDRIMSGDTTWEDGVYGDPPHHINTLG